MSNMTPRGEPAYCRSAGPETADPEVEVAVARVKRGAAWLDVHRPDWYLLADPDWPMPGQMGMRWRHSRHDAAWRVNHGFGASNDMLREAWTQEINDRIYLTGRPDPTVGG